MAMRQSSRASLDDIPVRAGKKENKTAEYFTTTQESAQEHTQEVTQQGRSFQAPIKQDQPKDIDSVDTSLFNLQTEKDIGTTQGKKGQKLKRINMAFSDSNHAFIVKESNRRGISYTLFVNQLVEAYRKQME